MRGILAASLSLKVRIIATALLLILSAGGFVQQASAQVWRDGATGQVVASGPILPESRATSTGQDIVIRGVRPEAGDPNRAFDPETGRNFVRGPCPPPYSPGRTTPPTTKSPPEPPKHATKTSRREKTPPATKQPPMISTPPGRPDGTH